MSKCWFLVIVAFGFTLFLFFFDVEITWKNNILGTTKITFIFQVNSTTPLNETNLSTPLNETNLSTPLNLTLPQKKVHQNWSVEAILSFAPFHLRLPRPGHRGLLKYWPHSWNIKMYLDSHPEEFVTCLQNTSRPPTFKFRQQNEFVFVDSPSFKVNHWKFYLDEGSTADILAFYDDDACLFQPYSYLKILNEHGQIITRCSETVFTTYTIGDRGYRLYTERVLGWQYIGDFMMDFPVFIWKEMLTELRQYLTDRFAFNNPKTFASAFSHLMSKENDGNIFSEYGIIMHYAWNTPKWRDRYEWQIYRENSNYSIFAGSLHDCDFCPINETIGLNHPQIWFYPYNVCFQFDAGYSAVLTHYCQPLALQKFEKIAQQSSWKDQVKLHYERIVNEIEQDDTLLQRSWSQHTPKVIDEWDNCFNRIELCRNGSLVAPCFR